jgi:pimeloyl-ACP methyl ester carboxylesterase
VLAAALLAGSLVLHPCAPHQAYYCGSLTRPLDTTGRIAGHIDIGFTWLPHARHDAPSAGTIVAAEGGPGYPSGASRDGYRALFRPLLTTYDMLLMDDRGTGRSGAIDCPSLQGGSMTLPAIARCGALLGSAAGLYGSAEAADDLDALMERLGITKADLYGDSYGTFFVQTFAARHPARVHRIVLDGAYPAGGLDPWYSSTTPAIAYAFDSVCRRSPQCAARGAAMPRIARVLERLRAGRGPIDAPQLAFVMDTAGLDSLVYRDLDAAVRASLERSDDVPLRRLAREASDFEEAASSDPREESNGLFVAASCTDNPQAYDMRLPPAPRQAQWRSVERHMAASHPQLYAPFTVAEFLNIPLDYAYVPLCQNWPVAPDGHPAGQPFPFGTRMPDVATLVLTGDLDTMTTPAEGDAAAKLFERSQRVIVRNTGHVTAIDDPWNCASAIVRTFLAQRPLDTGCAARIPPTRLVDAFARTRSEVTPATLAGGSASLATRRNAANALAAAGDALARAQQFGTAAGSGLRGGRYSVTPTETGSRIELRGVRWTSDFPVFGSVDWNRATGAVVARLRAPGLRETASWNIIAGSRARLRIAEPGSVEASAPAP